MLFKLPQALLLANGISFHLGYFLTRGDAPVEWVALESGAVACLLSELAAFFVGDYAVWRRGGLSRVSFRIDPPQLVLKGGWGVLLIAFLFALIAALALRERGWVFLVGAVLLFVVEYVVATRGSLLGRLFCAICAPFVVGVLI